MIVLNESFKEIREACHHRKYYQKYSNEEYCCNGREFGEWGRDYGHIKCTHNKSSTSWCKDDAEEKDCPRILAS